MTKDKLSGDGMAGSSSACHFGEHLTLDGYGGDPDRLNDEKLIHFCLDELPGLLEMAKLAEPQVYFAAGNGGKDPGGWTGVVVVAESHISIHTFPRRKFVSIDVYSCKNGMNLVFIENYFRKKFSLQEIERNFIKRGTKYPACNIC